MDAQKIQKALKKIAKKEGVSVGEVRREIEKAIQEARSNPDPKIQAFWNSIPYKGDELTPEDVIAHISGIVDEKNKGGQ
jgi:ribosome recycling factor